MSEGRQWKQRKEQKKNWNMIFYLALFFCVYLSSINSCCTSRCNHKTQKKANHVRISEKTVKHLPQTIQYILKFNFCLFSCMRRTAFDSNGLNINSISPITHKNKFSKHMHRSNHTHIHHSSAREVNVLCVF